MRNLDFLSEAVSLENISSVGSIFLFRRIVMESILDNIAKDEVWNEYLNFKENQASFSKQEIENLKEFISSKKYCSIAKSISNGEYVFSIPTKHLINKVNKSKKRVVYSYREEENYVLKVITYLFSKKYDEQYAKNCYSFRRGSCVKNAINRITSTKNLNELYGYKIDISNYFNSVDIDLLFRKLEIFLSDDKKLLQFIKNLLSDDRAVLNDEIVYENKGIMAGVPISSFLANIFLKDVDEFFDKENILYLRYSDDIIIFAKNDEINFYIEKLNELIELNKLRINEEKKLYINPKDKWDFLGFSFENGEIDISNVAKQKIKGKIKRASRKLRRWMLKKDATADRAIMAMNRKFNKKFYMIENTNELTWNLWYFPVINTTKGLHEIDLYMQQSLRYIATGRYNKKNYNIRYEDLKKLGYKPLVAEYYNFKNKKRNG